MGPFARAFTLNAVPGAKCPMSRLPSFIQPLMKFPSPRLVTCMPFMEASIMVLSMDGSPVILPLTVPLKPPSAKDTDMPETVKSFTVPLKFPEAAFSLSLLSLSCGAKYASVRMSTVLSMISAVMATFLI